MTDAPIKLAGGIWPVIDSREAPKGAGMTVWAYAADCSEAARAALAQEGVTAEMFATPEAQASVYEAHGVESRAGMALGLWLSVHRARAILHSASRPGGEALAEAVAGAFIHLTQLRGVLDNLHPGGVATRAVVGGKTLAGSAEAAQHRQSQAERDVMDRYGRLALEFAKAEKRSDPEVLRAEIIRRLRIAWPSMTARDSLPGDRALSDFLAKHGIT